MTSPPLRLTIAVVRMWTRLYTWRMPQMFRDIRRAEIESDLWEFQQDAEAEQRLSPAAHILVRLLIGIPHDLCWRVEHRAVEGVALQSLAVPGVVRHPRVTASAFVCSLTLHALAGVGAVWLASLPMERPGFAIQAQYAKRFADVSYAKGFSPVTAAGGAVDVARAGIVTVSYSRSGEIPSTWGKLLAGIAVAAAPAFAPWRHAQSPADIVAPSFDVASVKPNRSGDFRREIGPQPGGRFGATNVTLRELMTMAYGIPQLFANVRVSGGPPWIDSDRFDVAARAEGTPPPEEIRLMLRTLLAERFKLSVHTETRELPIYALVMARADGRPGPQLRRSEVDCAALYAAARDAEARGLPSPLPPQLPGVRPTCGRTFRSGSIAGGGWTMTQLATTLAPVVNRVVLDRTGVTGGFDLDLAWTPDQPSQQPAGAGGPPPNDPNGPSIFTALQEQLGLKLEATRGPVEVLVVDRAESLTPD